MLRLYSVLYGIALGFLLPVEYLKRPKKLRERWLRERFGEPPGKDSPPPCLWVHAVSVGEVLAAVPFLKALRERRPGLRLVVSTVTDTGQKVAAERLSGIAEIIYMPFDIPSVLRSAVARLRPMMAVIMETEIWPNLFRTLRTAGVPVMVLNGRISESSYKGYRKIRFFIKEVLADVDTFCMQDEEYARRIVDLGADKKKVIITGNFKFDIKVELKGLEWADSLSRPVVVAGSTHKGEEELVAAAFAGLREEFPGLNLIIAPRHPERVPEVEAVLRARGLPCARRSAMPETALRGSVVILDTVGELASVYSMADVAVVGGSFVEHGGQNPLEPAYWGRPAVCGPHMWNFPFVEEFYGAGAAVATDRDGLYGTLRDLLSSPEKRGEMGNRAREFLERNRGAVQRAVRVVEERLEGLGDRARI
ncbi:MAG: 3-deoxy-D-manno-octulosonic acid transferase [Thermodesulfovibrionales bacterium]